MQRKMKFFIKILISLHLPISLILSAFTDTKDGTYVQTDEMTEMVERKGQIKIYGNDRLADRVNIFQQQANKHEEKQKSNPFSGQFDKNSTGMTKDDPRYGRPPEGSKTEMRGKKAASHISKEIFELCNLIREYGMAQDDGTILITFGELFQMYTVISNKIVGLLLRARKHGLVHFDGEMLYQRRDDDVIITLFPFDPESDEEEEETMN